MSKPTEIDTNGKRRPTFQMSADTRLVAQYILNNKRVGETVTYKELEPIVGRAVDGSFGPLQSAKRHLQRQHGMVFGSVPRVGSKVLTDPEIVQSVHSETDRLRRRSRRAVERLSLVKNFASLPRDLQATHNAGISIMSVIGAMTTSSAVKKIEAAVSKAQRELPMAETIKALGLAPA